MTPHAHDFPALHGLGVTQAHTDDCARRGHAAHIVDGLDTGVCPRCGVVTETHIELDPNESAITDSED